MNKDSLGDRMKFFESMTSPNLFLTIPIVARLDGKSFHTFTKNLGRPYDKRLSNLMMDTASFLVKETNAKIAYTQSDEITLIWLVEKLNSSIMFDGKIQKMNSVITSMCTCFFNKNLSKYIPEKSSDVFFDCRIFQVPSKIEAVNCLIWREQDAVRNSVQMAARSIYSHKECHKKNNSELQEMLFAKKINWNDYPDFFKRGTYIRRKILKSTFTKEEIEKLNPNHDAIKNPDLIVERSVIQRESFPILTKIQNKENVIFNDENPILIS